MFRLLHHTFICNLHLSLTMSSPSSHIRKPSSHYYSRWYNNVYKILQTQPQHLMMLQLNWGISTIGGFRQYIDFDSLWEGSKTTTISSAISTHSGFKLHSIDYYLFGIGSGLSPINMLVVVRPMINVHNTHTTQWLGSSSHGKGPYRSHRWPSRPPLPNSTISCQGRPYSLHATILDRFKMQQT